jgi:hypothetical protein
MSRTKNTSKDRGARVTGKAPRKGLASKAARKTTARKTNKDSSARKPYRYKPGSKLSQLVITLQY